MLRTYQVTCISSGVGPKSSSISPGRTGCAELRGAIRLMIDLRGVSTHMDGQRAKVFKAGLEVTFTGLLTVIAAPLAAVLVVGGQLMVVFAVVLRAACARMLTELLPFVKREADAGAASDPPRLPPSPVKSWSERSVRPPGCSPPDVTRATSAPVTNRQKWG